MATELEREEDPETADETTDDKVDETLSDAWDARDEALDSCDEAEPRS